MKKSDIKKMPAYFDRYIHLTDDVTCLEALDISLRELQEAPIDTWRALNNSTYAPGKWSVKDILQHYIDTERVFAYRITAIARAEKQILLPYDEDAYAAEAEAGHRSVDELWQELILLRQSTIAMYKGFQPHMFHRVGEGFNNIRYCVLSLGFMIAGHQRWHMRVLQERYYPMVQPS